MRSFLLVLIWSLCGSGVGLAVGKTVQVPGDFPTIAAALESISAGDVIQLAPGMYRESLQVHLPASLRGDSARPGAAVIEAPSYTDSCLHVDTGIQTGPVMLEGVTIQGAAAERGIAVSGSSAVLVESCVFTKNLTGIEAAGNSSVTLTDCAFLGNYTSGAQATARATLTVTSCSFEGTGEEQLVRTLDGSAAAIDVEECTFVGTWNAQDDISIFGVMIGEGTRAVVQDCEFYGLAVSIRTVGGSSLVAKSNRIRTNNIGIVIRNPAYSQTTAQILSNNLQDCNAGIRLYGGCGRVDISQNTISAQWVGIDVYVPACEFQPEDVSPFHGTITGTSNRIDEGSPTCPPWTSPFWPAGFRIP